MFVCYHCWHRKATKFVVNVCNRWLIRTLGVCIRCCCDIFFSIRSFRWIFSVPFLINAKIKRIICQTNMYLVSKYNKPTLTQPLTLHFISITCSNKLLIDFVILLLHVRELSKPPKTWNNDLLVWKIWTTLTDIQLKAYLYAKMNFGVCLSVCQKHNLASTISRVFSRFGLNWRKPCAWIQIFKSFNT